MLDPIVDARAPFLGRLRKRIALATGFLIGVSSVAAILILRPPPPPPPAPPAPAPRPISLTVPPPLIIKVEEVAPVPPAAPPPPADELGCPSVELGDAAVGKPFDIGALPSDASSSLTVVAASRSSQIAVLADDRVWISDDNGATFRRAFADSSVAQIAIGQTGVVFAIATRDDQLGVRKPGGRTTWRELPCGDSCGQIATQGDDLVWIHNGEIAVSTTEGKTWSKNQIPDVAWGMVGGRLFQWRGSVYQVQHYTDMCGVDDTNVMRLDAKHDIAGDIFHNYYTTGQPALKASNDVDPTWIWTERCWADEEHHTLERCAKRDLTQVDLLMAGTLLPAEGARTLAVWQNSLVEMCPRGARQIYRAFPFDHLDAVDSAGRPLVGHGTRLYQWSPRHGWRTLFSAPEPPPSQADAE